MNYDASQIGVPFVRASRIIIDYPDAGQLPSAAVEQTEAVKLADETVRKLRDLPVLSFACDLVGDATTPIPLVHPDTGEVIPGQFTTLQQAFMVILAVIRKHQLLADSQG
jgi:hypothetical protein